MSDRITAVVLPGLDGTGELLNDFVRALKPDLSPSVVAYPPHEILGYRELER